MFPSGPAQPRGRRLDAAGGEAVTPRGVGPGAGVSHTALDGEGCFDAAGLVDDLLSHLWALRKGKPRTYADPTQAPRWSSCEGSVNSAAERTGTAMRGEALRDGQAMTAVMCGASVTGTATCSGHC